MLDICKKNDLIPSKRHDTEGVFDINPECEKLSSVEADEFHHFVAKLLYLAKWAQPDILLAVTFLCTRVKGPDQDDYKRLGRCLSDVQGTKELCLTLEAKNMSMIHW